MGREDIRTAAVLIIGNELLSGKVQEANLVVLARALRSIGVALRRVVVVPDEVDAIAGEVRALSGAHDAVFTSGGVGPTHDDVTVEAVAKAFGVGVVRAPEIVELLRGFYKDRCTEAHLRMALVPAGATLERTQDVAWPTIRVRNVWLLPGIPEAFRMKVPVVVAKLGGGRRFFSTAVYTQMDEGDLKPLLDAVVAAYPDIDVGSYPKWADATYRTKVTFDGLDEARVRLARDALVSALPAGEPRRVD